MPCGTLNVLDATISHADPEVGVSTEIERRLDAANHQGELDQLAVKVALLKKLITRATSLGAERGAMLKDALKTVLGCCPRHLASAIREHFEQ